MNRELGSILLVAGTTIGAGMLALPVTSGLSGFMPAALLFFLFWGVMYFSALLMLEVNLALSSPTHEVNMVSMARLTLGPLGAKITWIVYLFLLYALTAAYLAGSGPLFALVGETFFGWKMAEWAAPLPLALLLGYFVISGTASVDRINRWLMLALLISFTAIFVFMGPYFDPGLLARVQISEIPLALSMAATSFGFHIVIPSLCTYLHRDGAKIKRALFWGSFIPLLVYLAWEALAIGIIPLEGPYGLLAGYERGDGAFLLMGETLGRRDLTLLASLFAFFSIGTSFLGVTLSLSSFLSDGLTSRHLVKAPWIVDLLTFVPPILFVWIEPRAFFLALDLAGAYGVIVLLLVIPVLMAYSLRKSHKENVSYRAPGGNMALILAALFSMIVIINQLYLQLIGAL